MQRTRVKEKVSPFKIAPILVEVVWGGTKLRKYNKLIPEGKKVGESWEVSTIKGRVSTISSGKFKDQKLTEILKQYPVELLGDNFASKYMDRFPLLLKFIDATDKLSVQVHPDEEYAKKRGGDIRSKSEAWLILEAEPSSWIVYGTKEGVTKRDIEKLIQEKGIEKSLNYVKVSPGDIIPIPPGTLHSIGPGILLLELQESSDTTFRFYDYDRIGLDGKPRPLHIKEALEVVNPDIKFEPISPKLLMDCEGFKRKLLYKSVALRMELIELYDKYEFMPEDRFWLMTVLEGEIKILGEEEEFDLIKGDTIFIPALSTSFTLLNKVKSSTLFLGTTGNEI